MLGWKRSSPLPIPLRRWIDVVRAAWRRWCWPYRWDLSIRPMVPPAQNVRHLLSKLEALEAREAPVSATVPVALLGAAALVHTTSARPDAADVEKPSTVADTGTKRHLVPRQRREERKGDRSVLAAKPSTHQPGSAQRSVCAPMALSLPSTPQTGPSKEIA